MQTDSSNGIIKSFYAGQYAMINRANDLIFNAEKSGIESVIVNRCVAEAKFCVLSAITT